ncbi:MAG TPA: hypothetical protein VJL29_13985 [Thermoguttaceae bacterium]|nr:hypothetical protein [Thermoguttaceae bacterium]
MLRKWNWIGVIALVGSCGLLVSAGGCDQDSGLPPLAVVTGQVMLDGKPLTLGEIGFIPDSSKGTAGPMGTGTISEDGRFSIRTAGHKGALVGFHKIRITAIDKTKADKPWIIPFQYGNPDESGLAVEVKPDQENTVNLPLKSKP